MGKTISIIQSLKDCILNLETAFWDKRLGIKTLGVRRGVAPTEDGNDDYYCYQSKCYSTVRACLRPVKMGAEDVFYDVGCGAGRVLCLVAQRRIRKCVGVELSEAFCTLARDNAQHLRGRRTPIEIVAGDATLVDYSDGTVFFFYNPFGPQPLQVVLRRIREGFLQKPRRILFIYLNPSAHHVFESQEWLQVVAKRSVGTGGLLVYYYSPAERRESEAGAFCQ